MVCFVFQFTCSSNFRRDSKAPVVALASLIPDGYAKANPLRVFLFCFLSFTKMHFRQLLKQKSLIHWMRLLHFSAVWTRLELATPCVTGRYSNQLNYQTVCV